LEQIIPMKILIVHYVTAMLIASNTANGLEVEHGDGLKLRGSPALSTFAEAVANQDLDEFAKGKKKSEAEKFANRAKNGSAKRSGNRGNKENEPKKSQAGRFANRAKDSSAKRSGNMGNKMNPNPERLYCVKPGNSCYITDICCNTGNVCPSCNVAPCSC